MREKERNEKERKRKRETVNQRKNLSKKHRPKAGIIRTTNHKKILDEKERQQRKKEEEKEELEEEEEAGRGGEYSRASLNHVVEPFYCGPRAALRR